MQDARSDRIVGVCSLSENVPVKQANFPVNYEDFEDKESYRERRFVYAPPAPPAQPSKSQPQAQPQPPPQADGAPPES